MRHVRTGVRLGRLLLLVMLSSPPQDWSLSRNPAADASKPWVYECEECRTTQSFEARQDAPPLCCDQIPRRTGSPGKDAQC